MDISNSPSNPTVADIQVYLVAHNGWSTEEFDKFIAHYAEYVSIDNFTTLLNHDQWTFLAANFDL